MIADAREILANTEVVRGAVVDAVAGDARQRSLSPGLWQRLSSVLRTAGQRNAQMGELVGEIEARAEIDRQIGEGLHSSCR